MARPQTDDSAQDKHVARELLIELLAHQFAFPVQWIKTQERLLDGPNAVQRLVELGPGSTLLGLARSTIQRQVATGHRIGEPVETLASTSDADQIAYRYEARIDLLEPAEATKDVSTTGLPPKEIPAPGPVAKPPTAIPVPTLGSQTAATQIADASITPSDILRALMARKLKLPMPEISLSKTLRELCNGRSTLQNEMVGDLLNEFGSLPDRPEDLSLSVLGEAISIRPETPLGKTTTAALQKLVGSKMPSGFRMADLQSYLSDHWALPRGRMTSVILYALASEPERRLMSVASVHSYLDGLASMYAAWAGLDLSPKPSQQDAVQTQAVALVPALSTEAVKASKRLAQKQYDALSEFLETERASHSSEETKASITSLQSQLDHWTAEFSDDFLSGIMPSHDPKKARRFDAYWRSARQELLEFYHSATESRQPLGANDFQNFLNRMRNKADPELAVIANGLGREAYEKLDSSPHVLGQLREVEHIISQHSDSVEASAIASVRCQRPRVQVTYAGEIQHLETDRNVEYPDLLFRSSFEPSHKAIDSSASVHVHGRSNTQLDETLTSELFHICAQALKSGMSFSGKHVLVTGAGPNSIGTEVVRLLLRGGARVIVTTSRAPSQSAKYYQRIYEVEGAKGSELLLLPFNQASVRDCDALVDYIYSPQSSGGLGRDLDAMLPFAAMAEEGAELSDLDGSNELVHRLMMTNVLRLLGRIIKNKRARGVDDNPTQVLLPLSPNHSNLGGDGMYSESKLGLESLLNRVRSESWSDELSICGVKIGWTRSTALTGGNDLFAAIMEDHGVLTFSVAEIAFSIATLMTQSIREACEQYPLLVDYSGGLGQLEDCHAVLAEGRQAIRSRAQTAKALAVERELEDGKSIESVDDTTRGTPVRQRCPIRLDFPAVPDYETQIQPLQQGFGDSIPDPANTVVIVGFSELGPFGSSRVRWEWERAGELSRAALIETAWFMGLITHVHEPAKAGQQQHVGWVDAKTREPVHEDEVEARYGEYIRAHIGIRSLEGEASGDDENDPTLREILEEISLQDDLAPFEAPAAAAEALKRRHKENITVQPLAQDADRCTVQLKRGATIMAPKSTVFDWGKVAGLLPTGFDASRYGLPNDLVRNLDPTALFAVCCVAEAFYSAGLPDPLELFKHIHLSELGNFLGSSIGGAIKVKNLYKDVYQGKDVEGDVLQDVYANTPAAWVNMLLLGSAGPIKTAVGACATGVESIDTGFDSIMSGKTQACIVGGVDDLQQDEAFGFSTLKATANAAEHLAAGRLPSEISRPAAESRGGFVESLGGGVQILCRADLALQMGLPIYGIVAGSAMASDGVGRSVPAPGRGILSFARECQTGPEERLGKDVDSRPESDEEGSRSSLSESSGYSTPLTPPDGSSVASGRAFFESKRLPNRTCWPASAKPSVVSSPFRSALETWGLSIDEIDLVSMHGTSTKANDINEPEVLSAEFDHLGRKPGHPVWAVCQKSITGHPKAPAAAWMLNGCLQAMASGVVPGNRNADNIDAAWQHFEHICLPTSPVQAKIRAFTLTSFGFGQKGGQVIGVSPKYLFATLSHDAYSQYTQQAGVRSQRAERAYVNAVMTDRIAGILDSQPYQKSNTNSILLDPTARLGADNIISRSIIPPVQQSKPVPQVVGKEIQRGRDGRRRQGYPHRSRNVRSVGVDVVKLANFTAHENRVFVERNFTLHEQTMAAAHIDPAAALAGRWCAKEAVFKCLRTHGKGAGAAMKSIEIVTAEGGMPAVSLSEDALKAAEEAGLGSISLSFAYEDDCVIAYAMGLGA
ncbi:sterigmatocystin biosynthesis fatty acid synthase subunit alpha [Lecanosticta acicola]|uniref:Sterigmatocystin biosynthesis fatty acid synthase subunit alpha n=1 Tax=Lecanosticta acicola TaxID=111012 RepID=A0AAI8Z8I0_9PEZI|nr:sterigmatocystin biosynthesis fatty acid synthase subunit alpha [Lecanosticta acicola]